MAQEAAPSAQTRVPHAAGPPNSTGAATRAARGAAHAHRASGSRGLLPAPRCCIRVISRLVTRLTLRTGDKIRTGARRSKTKNEDWNRPLAIPAATFPERLTVSCKPWAKPGNRRSSMPPRCFASDLVALSTFLIAEGDACSAGADWKSLAVCGSAGMIVVSRGTS